MKTIRIPDGKGGFVTSLYSSKKFEFIDPVDYYKKAFIKMNTDFDIDLLSMRNPEIAPKNKLESIIAENFFSRKYLQKWEAIYKEIVSVELHQNILSLLGSNSKKTQVKFLRGMSLSPYQLIAFIFIASEKYNYTFSQYISEHHHKGLDESKLPKFIHLSEDKVETSGTTEFTEGQLKNIIENRKVVIAKFIENEDEWHCFFVTFRSLKGEEKAWKEGQPHFHYISSSFGMSREKVISELCSRKYKLNSLPHIDLIGFG